MSELAEIVDILMQKRDATIIEMDKVKVWMTSSDIEVLGAVYILITEKVYYKRIKPVLSLDDYTNFLIKYFEQCIIDNPNGEWSDSRYTAGWDFVNWFKIWWNDPQIPRENIKLCKLWLKELYLSNNEDIRMAIETAILEHLFDDKEITKYFKDWADDPNLSEAYERSA